MAKFLEIPEAILQRPATTDTYSLFQSQEEFYFSVPLETLDLILFADAKGFGSADIAEAARLTVDQVKRILADVSAKRRAAAYLHATPSFIPQASDSI